MLCLNSRSAFRRADMSKFIVQDEFDSKRKATARVLFPDGGGSWENALIEDSKYWSHLPVVFFVVFQGPPLLLFGFQDRFSNFFQPFSACLFQRDAPRLSQAPLSERLYVRGFSQVGLLRFVASLVACWC